MATQIPPSRRRVRLGRWSIAALALSLAIATALGVGVINGLTQKATTAEASAAKSASMDGVSALARATADEVVKAITVTAATDNSQVQAQLDYVNSYWQNYNSDYGVIDGNDCVNFTSQSLIARGWVMDDGWWSESAGDLFDHSSPWVSSTSFRDYLEESGRATALNDDQRELVKLGDVVQFDWDNSGDRDHTAVVTRVERTGERIVIYYGGHTDDTDFRSVDWAIDVNHPGATAYYWSIPE